MITELIHSLHYIRYNTFDYGGVAMERKGGFNVKTTVIRYFSATLTLPNQTEYLEELTCGIIDSFSLKSCNPISFIDTPSIRNLPLGSASRNKADINDDLPAPVRPTIPTYLNPNKI